MLRCDGGSTDRPPDRVLAIAGGLGGAVAVVGGCNGLVESIAGPPSCSIASFAS